MQTARAWCERERERCVHEGTGSVTGHKNKHDSVIFFETARGV